MINHLHINIRFTLDIETFLNISSIKINNRTKDKINKLDKSGVYKFNCADYASYVDRTCRTLFTRI